MKNIITIIFFISFYRISLFNSIIILPFIFGLFFTFPYVYSLKKINTAIEKYEFWIIFISAFIVLHSFLTDVLLGNIYNILNSFYIRVISIFIMSFMPAVAAQKFYIKGEKSKLDVVIYTSFLFQTILFLMAYLNYDLKILFYQILGLENSANLRDYNMNARGFGLSLEINYTMPFMMVLSSLVILKNIKFYVVIFLTQIINSNLTIFSVPFSIIMYTKSIKSFILYTSLSLLFIYLFYLFSEDFFPRLYAEFKNENSRTIEILLSDHLVFLPDNFIEYITGTGVYIFENPELLRSDIGWIILYNYGGFLYILFCLLLIILISILAFGKSRLTIIWILSGLLLNTKGLLIGPNSYIFMTVLMIYHRKWQKYVSR